MKKIIYITFIFTIVNLYGSKSLEINLSKQRIYAKENGKTVFSGSVSTGKRGHSTPRGNFKVIDKERFHISNKYPEPNGGAKMPYMLRLTNGGVAIHQGYLPGYPASHGCIRVSKATAKKLWYWTKIGVPVKITGNASNYKYTKRKKIKKSKKHYKKRRYASGRKYKKPVYRTKKRVPAYEVVEVYDSW